MLICFYAILICKQVRNKASLHLLYSLHVARVKEHKGTNVFYCKTFLLKWINVFYLSRPYLILFKAGFKVFTFKISNCLSKKFTNQIAKMHLINLVFKHLFETQCTMHCINTVLIWVLGRIIGLDNHNDYYVVFILGEFTTFIYLP